MKTFAYLKMAVFAALISFAFALALPAQAAETTAVINGNYVAIPELSQELFNDNGRLWAPVANMAKAFEAEVINKNDRTLICKDNHEIPIENGQIKMRDGIPFVKVRAFAEAFHLPVIWDAKSQMALLGSWPTQLADVTDEPYWDDCAAGDDGYVLALPKNWTDEVTMIEKKRGDDLVMTFYVSDIYKSEIAAKGKSHGMGELFTIAYTDKPIGSIIPAQILAYRGPGSFIEVQFPSDVRYEAKDSDKYNKLLAKGKEMLKTFRYRPQTELDEMTRLKEITGFYTKQLSAEGLQKMEGKNLYFLNPNEEVLNSYQNDPTILSEHSLKLLQPTEKGCVLYVISQDENKEVKCFVDRSRLADVTDKESYQLDRFANLEACLQHIA